MRKFLTLAVIFILIASSRSFAINFDNTTLSPNDVAYAAQPYIYENNEVAALKITSDAETLRKLTPEPLIPNVDNTIYFYIGEFNLKRPYELNYREAGLLIPVTYKDGDKIVEGRYFPVMYLDHIDAIIGGREIYGYPKFMADISFTRTDKIIHGNVKIDGETLIDATFDITTEIENGQLSSWDMLSLKRIPAADLKEGNIIKQIISTRQNGIEIHEMHSAAAKLNLYSVLGNPLGDITIEKTSNPFFRVENMTINEGKVLHDYLLK